MLSPVKAPSPSTLPVSQPPPSLHCQHGPAATPRQYTPTQVTYSATVVIRYFTCHTPSPQPTCCLNPRNLLISVTLTGPCQQLSSSQPSTTVVSLRTNQS